MTPNERIVDLRPRTILRVLLIVVAVAVTLEVVWIARHVLDVGRDRALPRAGARPARRLDRAAQHDSRRGAAIGVAYLMLLIVIVAIGAIVRCRS